MRRNFKKSIAGALAGLMVLGSLQPLNAQAMEIDSSMIKEMEISSWETDEVTTTEVTYNFIDLENVNSYGVTLTVGDGGELTADFQGQYQESFYKLPEGLDSSKIKKVVLNLTSGSNLATKLYSDAEGTQQSEVAYTNEIVPTAEFASIGIMNLVEGANSVKISGITLTYEGEVEITKTFTFDELKEAKNGGVPVAINDGAATYPYTGQYQEVFYEIPSVINCSKVHKVTFNVTSDNASDLAYKFYTADNFAGDWPQADNANVSYGNAEVALASFDGMKYFGIMSMLAEEYSATVESVTFHTTGWGYSGAESGEITYGDNIIVNPNFADADVTAWNSEAGESTITVETADAAIFDDITTYGKIERTPGTSETGDAFVQDITANVEAGAEYQVEFYAMLSEDYNDIDVAEYKYVKDAEEITPTVAELTQVDFAPYYEDAEGNRNYRGASYATELSGKFSQSLTPGQWTKFEGTFKVACSDGDRVVIRIIEQGTNYGSGSCVLGDYYITGVSMKKINKPKPEIEKDIPDWKDSITKELGGNTIAGTCFGVSSISDEALMELSTKHFNAISFENELKPDSLLTSSPKLNGATFKASNGMTIDVPDLTYTNPNKMLDFVKKWNEDNDGNIKIRGHVLVWHSQTPEWFFHENYDAEADYVDKDEMDARLEWYIKTVLEYYTKAGSEYEGMFYGWDVVNEAMSDGTGKPRKASDNSNWARIYGDESNEYIIKAFRFANQYAPAELELYYNDYNDSVPLKCAGITQLLKDIKAAEGTRIDAMGMQAHHGMSDPTISQIEAAVRSYAGVVGAVQLTELDLKASNTYDGTDKTRGDEYTKQAYRYKEIFDLLVKLDKEDDIEVTGITMWGTIDKLSWLQSSNSVGGASQGGNQCPLLFDDDYKAKPAFWAFVDASKLEPNIQKVVAVEKIDDSYAQGKEYKLGKATFVPMWDKDGLKILFNVQDANVDETDAITVYVDPAMSKAEVTPVKVEVKRADATATDGGYKAEVTVPLNNVAVAAKVGFDVVITDGNDKVVFNDLKSLYETSSKYYAELVMKPYATIAKTSAAITIDGEADAAWNNVNAIPLSINLGSQVEADAKLLWDATNLYVYAEVKDAVLDATSSAVHEKDSLEVFIDENNAKTESYEADDKQYRVNYLNEQTFNGTKCNADNIQSKVKLTDTGYVVEAAYKWTDITPAEGTEIGLELQINDAQNGTRIGTLSWYDESGQGWTSTAVYGTVKLVAGKKEVVDKVFDFEDVDIIEGNWKYEAVKYVYNRDIMGKVGASNQFQPDNPLTRAMFATVLYRVAGEPEVEFVEVFPDVAAGKWYSEAIIWANKNGIVNGYSTGDYGVNDNITREQIAKMLYEYAQNVAGYDVSGKADIEKFTDCGDVSVWAVDYIKWAADAEMITGKPNGDGTFRIDPKGQATRAECAKMIQKFLEKYE